MEELVFFREVAAASCVPAVVPSAGLPPAGVRGQLPRDGGDPPGATAQGMRCSLQKPGPACRDERETWGEGGLRSD